MLLYPLLILVTIIIPIFINYSVKDTNKIYDIQSENGEWFFKCTLETTNLVYSLMEEILIIVILIKGKYIFKYNYIFKNTRYITYSNIAQIFLGPLINVIIDIILLYKIIIIIIIIIIMIMIIIIYIIYIYV